MPDLTGIAADISSVAGAAMPIAGAVTGIAQTVLGAIEKGRARRRQQNLLSQRRGFETPSEIYDALYATQFNANRGLSAEMRDFLSSQIESQSAASIDAVSRISNDPNIISRIFQTSLDGTERIAATDVEAQTRNFSMFLQQLNTLGANKAAEQKSRQDILKDKLAAEGVNIGTSNQEMQSGINLLMNTLGLAATNELYKDRSEGLPQDTITPNRLAFLNRRNELNANSITAPQFP